MNIIYKDKHTKFIDKHGNIIVINKKLSYITLKKITKDIELYGISYINTQGKRVDPYNVRKHKEDISDFRYVIFKDGFLQCGNFEIKILYPITEI